MQLLEETQPPIPAFISFNSLDGVHSVRGDPFEQCVQLAETCPYVVAVGVNCTAPKLIYNLISKAQKVMKVVEIRGKQQGGDGCVKGESM